MIDINLAPAVTKLPATAQKWQRNLFLIASAAGVLVLAAGGLVFALSTLLSSQIATLTSQRQEQMAQFEVNTPKLITLVSLSDKIVGIKRVVAVRPNLSVAIAAQQELLVDGVAVTRLVIGTGGSMNFDVTVRDVAALSSYLNRLESDQAKSFFTDLKISGLSIGQNGGFLFTVNALFDKSKLVGSKNAKS